MFTRILNNTIKQVRRSGWVAWASVAVMTLAFFVATVFAGLAYLSNQYIKFIETRDNILVFFEVGVDPVLIDTLRSSWDRLPEVKNIGFTTEEEAYDLYLKATENTSPIEHKLLKEYQDKKLPSSLDIQLFSLNDLDKVVDVIVVDVEDALELLDYQSGEELPIVPRVDDQTLDEYQVVFSYLRAGGTVILVMLFIIIFFFTLTTVEFRIYNRMEEIGVMQLVGGSLWYIRSPYILEGAFHGFMGALLSSIVIGGTVYAIFLTNAAPALKLFIFERIGVLNLPEISLATIAILIAAKLFIGFMLGAVSSYLAIRRYIK